MPLRMSPRAAARGRARRAALLADLGVLRDVVDGVLDGLDLLRILVRDFDVEGLFEGHDQLDRVQRIGAQVVHERSIGRDLGLVHTQLLDDDLLYFFLNCCHWLDASSTEMMDCKWAAGSV